MADILNFTGFIKDVSYRPQLIRELTQYDFENFDINNSNASGVLKFGDNHIGYSKWVSPKRTRSYPFARIYDTFNTAKIITIIPIIKDEGASGDIDRIQYSTISWMNLLNVYIVLAFYESAEKSLKRGQEHKQKITNQKFNNDFVKAQISEIISYKQSALHWNRSLIENRFVTVFQKALESYETIFNETGVQVHSQKPLKKYIDNVLKDFNKFKELSLKSSAEAAIRETKTKHRLEYLSNEAKAKLVIANYLGGVYHLTADEVIRENQKIILQESKNSSEDFLPKMLDIKDGLFKLILYANLNELLFENEQVNFSCRLKLTGKCVKRDLKLPCSEKQVEEFWNENQLFLTVGNKELLNRLNMETKENKRLEIEIACNN